MNIWFEKLERVAYASHVIPAAAFTCISCKHNKGPVRTLANKLDNTSII
jgi:hypothetical protein